MKLIFDMVDVLSQTVYEGADVGDFPGVDPSSRLLEGAHLVW